MSDADDALAAAAEAEAEAAEAEAMVVAARARARAIRLRRAAATLESAPGTGPARATPPPSETPTSAPGESGPADEPDDATAASESAAAESAAAESAVAPPAARRAPLFIKVAAASVAVLCSLALVGLSAAMYLNHRSQEARRQDSAQFAAGARQGVVTLMSLDFNKAKEDAQRIIDNTTGDFRKDFERQAKEFVKVAQDSKVVTEANVNAVAVQSMTKNTATVLVAVATNVSNKASSQQTPRSWRLSVDVARDGDQIKLSKVEFVQ